MSEISDEEKKEYIDYMLRNDTIEEVLKLGNKIRTLKCYVKCLKP